MKTSLIIFILILLSQHLSAQAFVYKTEAEYLQNEGTSYTSFKTHYNKGMTDYAVFMQNGEKEEIKCNTIWGFKTETGDFYRIFKPTDSKKDGEPLLLIHQGRFCLWMQGTKKVKKDVATYYVVFTYCSNDLLTQIYNKQTFIEENPKYSKLIDCSYQDLNCQLEYLYSLGEKEEE